jgi:hypothetical protein
MKNYKLGDPEYEKLKAYYRVYDRIEYLTLRLQEVKATLLSDDLALKIFLQKIA